MMNERQTDKCKYNEIHIYFKSGKITVITKDLWDDYTYLDRLFVVISNGTWIRIYNMDEVEHIEVH